MQAGIIIINYTCLLCGRPRKPHYGRVLPVCAVWSLNSKTKSIGLKEPKLLNCYYNLFQNRSNKHAIFVQINQMPGLCCSINGQPYNMSAHNVFKLHT